MQSWCSIGIRFLKQKPKGHQKFKKLYYKNKKTMSQQTKQLVPRPDGKALSPLTQEELMHLGELAIMGR